MAHIYSPHVQPVPRSDRVGCGEPSGRKKGGKGERKKETWKNAHPIGISYADRWMFLVLDVTCGSVEKFFTMGTFL